MRSETYTAPLRLDTAALLFIPCKRVYNGVTSKVWPLQGLRLFCEVKTYGGSEQVVDGIYSVLDTAIIKCWYDPRITAGCRIGLDTGETYEVVGQPEDVGYRHQHMALRVERVTGGA